MAIMNNRVAYFLKNTVIFLLGSFGSKFLTFLLLPMYTSILSTDQYGQIDLVTTTQSLLLPIVTLGLAEAVLRFAMNEKINNKSVLSNSIIAVLFSYICVFSAASIVNIFLKWEYMLWMLALLACSMFYDIFTNYLKAYRDSKKYVAVGVLYTLINLSGNIIFIVFLHLEVKGFLIAAVLSYFLVSLIIFLKEKIYKQIKFRYADRELAKRMLRYSFPLIFTSLSWWVVTSSDKYMIRYFMSNSAVGIYSIASKIPLILQTLITVLQTVWQISTNQMHDEEPQQINENFRIFTRAFRQTGFIAGSLLIIITQPLMMILAKNEFYEGWIYAPFLILSIVFSFATGMVSTLYGAYEKNSGVLYSVLIGGIVNIILNFIFIPRIGVMGATISTAISRLVISIYRLKDTEKILKFDREYGAVAVNCILIIVQCCLLVFVKKMVYPIQIAFFIMICFYNREIFSKGIYYIIEVFRRNKSE